MTTAQASSEVQPSVLRSMSGWQAGMGLTSKLVLVVGLACSLVFLGLVVFSIQMDRHARRDGTEALVQQAKGLVAGIHQLDEASRQSAEQSFSILSDRLPLVLFTLFDMGDGKVQLQHAGFPLESNTDAVDTYAALTGGVATVFQREGDDFRRITTSLKKEDGSRAVNTLLDRQHPAYKLMLEGQPYLGRAVLFGKAYMTKYEPIKHDGKVIGILFIGLSMERQLSDLKNTFQLTGDASVATLAIDIKPGARLGVAMTREQQVKMDPSDPLMQALQEAVKAGSKEGQLAALESVPTLKGEGAATVGWALYEPWGWVLVQAQRNGDMLSTARNNLILLWSIIGVGALLAAVCVVIALRRLVLFPLRSLLQAVDQLQLNDYSRPLTHTSRDELGHFIFALEGMRRQLSANMRQMEQSARDIDAVARDVARGNSELGGRTESAANSLQQSAGSLAHLTDAVNQSADAARQANQLASSAAKVAARGGEAVHQVVATMEDIHRSSQKIADIIGVIDSIAFQTNILALNAAVEAARAGEAGRGFAVVASEVRNLAGRSAQAAKEIKDLITASVDKVHSGSLQVQSAGQTMQEIVDSVQRVTDVIAEITAAASAQSTGIGQVNGAVGQLDHMTQQNAALVEEVAAAAENLSQQTSRLREALGQYKTGHSTEVVAQATPAVFQPSTRSAASVSAAVVANPAASGRTFRSGGRQLPQPLKHPDAHAARIAAPQPGVSPKHR